ncbi:MAG: efflux RND transporter periplasmic adaptor subunit [Pseudomonadota bacterium]
MRVTSLLLALAATGFLGWWFVLRVPPEPAVVSSMRAPAEPAAVRVTVVESVAEETRERTLLRGRTEANRAVDVRAETAGLVASEPLRAGARVAEGEVLCRLDAGSRAAQRKEMEARLAEARAEATAAQTLSAKGFTAETTRIAREAQLEAAAAALELVERDIDRLEIRAPFAGILETDAAERGALLSIGDRCATLIDLSLVKITAFVSEQDVDRIAPGQPVAVRLVNGMEREGAIRFIGRMADEDTRTYRVETVLENADGQLRDGMTAELVVSLDAGRAHRLPQSALTLDDTGRLGVRVVEEGIARFRPVRVLRDSAEEAWLTGLPERATVIVVGQEFVRDGRRVEPLAIGKDELG